MEQELDHQNDAEQRQPIEPTTVDTNDPEKIRKRQEQALMFEKYLDESGLSLSF